MMATSEASLRRLLEHNLHTIFFCSCGYTLSYSIFKTTHTLVLKEAILLPQRVSTLLSLQGRSLTHLHHIKPKTFLYLGMKPSNSQGCCKLLRGGGNNHHLEGSPSQIHTAPAARASPVTDKVFCMFF